MVAPWQVSCEYTSFMTAVLAIDQGTTGSTALVFSPAGEIIGRAYSEFTQYYPQPGWVEHDPEEIWQVSRRVMAEALSASGLGAGDLSAIGITNQRETTVVWDGETGKPVYRAVVWQSRQSAGICERLKAEGLEPLFREKTGLVMDAYFAGTKIRWILDQDPELQRRAEAGELKFGTIDSWLLWKLTGGDAKAGALHRTDPTNASRSLLYDIHEQAWDQELCGLLDIPMSMLPEVRPSAGVFGETGEIEGLPKGVPIAGIAGDQQAALYGQGCWAPGEAKNTYGTGCFLLMNMGQQHPVSQNGLLTTICCDAKGAPAYALEGSIFVAGSAVQWLRDELKIINDAAETDAIAREIEGNDGVYLVPAFVGLGAPYWDANARGAVTGLTRGSGRAHFVRAALEAIAYQTRDIVEVMNLDFGVEFSEFRVDGGASKNDFLMQFQADILGVTVNRPELVETTAAGSAYLAGLAVGVWSSPAEIEQIRRTDRLFEPRMENGPREALYAGWQDAVSRVQNKKTAGTSTIGQQRGRVKTADGLELVWRSWVPAAPKGIILVIHGLAEHGGRYRETAEFLSENGWAVYACDLRAHGLSPDLPGAGRVHVDRFTDYFLDVDALVGLAKEKYEDLPVYILGHSMGGLISISYALENPGALSGAIISSPALGTHPDFKPPAFLKLMVSVLSVITPRLLVDSDLDTDTISRDPEVVKAYIDDPLISQKVSARWYREILKAIKQANRNAASLKTPMLLMQSGADRLVDPSAPGRWAKSAPPGLVEPVLWDGLFHEMLNEPEKHQVRSRIIEWLEKKDDA